MSGYSNVNRGAIWKNEKKEKDEHPDFTGSLNVDGVEYWVSAWRRKGDASAKAPALTFTVKPKEERRLPVARTDGKSVTRRSSAEMGRDDGDSDIPF